MSQYIQDEVLIDYLSGQVTNEVAMSIETALQHDIELANRLDVFRAIFQDYTQVTVAVPSVTADQRFQDFLLAETTKKTHQTKQRKLWPKLAAAAAILLVFSLGWFSGQLGQRHTEDALAANRALMLELMKNDRTSERIKATTVALEAGETDATLVDNLIYLLNNDENTNVKLAAFNALLRFIEQAKVQDSMLATIEGEAPMIIKIQIIESLIRLGHKDLLPYLERMQNDDSIPLQLRDAAKLATFKLS